MISPFIKEAHVVIDGVQYRDEVSNVTFTPTTANQSWNPLSGNSVSTAQVTAWNVAFTYGQDYDTADSLASYVQANQGQPCDIQFVPTDGSTKAWATTISALMPGNIGGAAGVAEATSTSPCVKPVHEAYTPPVG
ncbi:hypothetical protein [Glutamicibacter sp. NPDC087673]|uniref:hypothetical protein n=1 Tax=Glutamicibacter sp. NPDC087673 TaxID=3363997 RepID=UPI0038092FCF